MEGTIQCYFYTQVEQKERKSITPKCRRYSEFNFYALKNIKNSQRESSQLPNASLVKSPSNELPQKVLYSYLFYAISTIFK